MEADPIGLEGGLNPYAYAGSNPVVNVGPSGLIYADQARPDRCYLQPFETRMYLSPMPSIPNPTVVNTCPSGNCFTDRLASTLWSDVFTLTPIGFFKNSAIIGTSIAAPEKTIHVLNPLNFKKD